MAFSRYLHSSEEPGETGSESPSPLPRGPRRTRQGSLFPGQVRAGPALSQLPFLTVQPSSPEFHQPPTPSWVLPSALDPKPAWPALAARAVEQLPHWALHPGQHPRSHSTKQELCHFQSFSQSLPASKLADLGCCLHRWSWTFGQRFTHTMKGAGPGEERPGLVSMCR